MGATELLLVRHGESLSNVAADVAEAAHADVIDVPVRDPDVPLTARGVGQAEAVGAWLRTLGPDAVPQSVWSSPYVRALQTAQLAVEGSGLALTICTDERLRDRELGVLDRLTTAGVEARVPAEAERRRWLGKFYHRPPGGESWADVALRVRTVLVDLDRQEHGRRVLVVCHDAVIMVVRYICEGLSEADVLEISRTANVRNASVTRLVRPDGTGRWSVDVFNIESHLGDLHRGEPHRTEGTR
ncbi:histidine phosphatase family protein [Pengzhenrongella frigida]|uniref:phosphoglycerate mutase (2,3-diphosphoglycerate-dependent) n=1 Tax=Pengzhenrongella frigida TaxID=1259133 RepID=A0A4Q5N0H8_9MICO|nr:histidine phosphatase family protein [Cellulomonas sp. HLT2-17]RYV51535.1 histidine phosphatase family protein [Cellulomonas sp. HLT2-17]